MLRALSSKRIEEIITTKGPLFLILKLMNCSKFLIKILELITNIEEVYMIQYYIIINFSILTIEFKETEDLGEEYIDESIIDKIFNS